MSKYISTNTQVQEETWMCCNALFTFDLFTFILRIYWFSHTLCVFLVQRLYFVFCGAIKQRMWMDIYVFLCCSVEKENVPTEVRPIRPQPGLHFLFWISAVIVEIPLMLESKKKHTTKLDLCLNKWTNLYTVNHLKRLLKLYSKNNRVS